MEIKIGELKVELSSASLYAGDSPAQAAVARMLRRKTRREIAYRWNCATQTGRPTQRPRQIRVTTEYILAPHEDIFALGNPRKYSSEKAWLAAADRSKSNFSRALKRALPDFVVPLDWAANGAPFKDLYSFDIVVQTQFMVVFGRPKGMTMKDHMFIVTPSDITVMPVVTGRCEGRERDGAILGGFTHHRAASDAPEHATYRELEPIILEETEAAREMRERLGAALGNDQYWKWWYGD